METWFSTKAPGGLLRALHDGAHANYLGSFFDPSISTSLTPDPAMISPDQFRFFLDSGAFSAWSKGAVIDLDEYIAFIKANIEHIEAYANLDCIPGAPGRDATAAEREAAARQSWENFEYMRSEGLDPIPVFHVGERWEWLERMMGACGYIGLGGMVGSHITPDLRRRWLDNAFARICSSNGMPRVKVHGFGMTAVPLIFRYPWYSVDSTTWIQVTANGAVMLPAMRDGAFVFDQAPTIVSVSTRNPKQAEAGKAANTLSPTMRAILERWLAECGKTFDEVASHYYHRAVCNVIFFKRVSELAAVRPFKADAIRRKSLLDHDD